MTIISILFYVEVPVAIDMMWVWCLALSLISHGSMMLRPWKCILHKNKFDFVYVFYKSIDRCSYTLRLLIYNKSFYNFIIIITFYMKYYV